MLMDRVRWLARIFEVPIKSDSGQTKGSETVPLSSDSLELTDVNYFTLLVIDNQSL